MLSLVVNCCTCDMLAANFLSFVFVGRCCRFARATAATFTGLLASDNDIVYWTCNMGSIGAIDHVARLPAIWRKCFAIICSCCRRDAPMVRITWCIAYEYICPWRRVGDALLCLAVMVMMMMMIVMVMMIVIVMISLLLATGINVLALRMLAPTKAFSLQ